MSQSRWMRSLLIGPGGVLVEVAAADALVAGSRVLAGMQDSRELAREQAAWLAAGTVPQVSGLDSDMVAMALLDLHVLSQPYGVPVAGWSGTWRYFWPRDSVLLLPRWLVRAHRRRGADRGLAKSAAGVRTVPGALSTRWQWSAGCSRHRADGAGWASTDSWQPSCPRRTGSRCCSGTGNFLIKAPRQHWH